MLKIKLLVLYISLYLKFYSIMGFKTEEYKFAKLEYTCGSDVVV